MLLSIITINLNNVSGLKKTINSIQSQTVKDFEYIVIDGNSIDGSVELILENKMVFSKVVIEKDTGIFNAMNKGVRMAEGEYLLFLNSGDYLSDANVIENIIPYLNDYDFISGDTIFEHETGYIKGTSPHKLTAYVIVRYALSHQSTFIRTDLLRKRPYREDLRIASDWEQELYELVFNDASYRHIPLVVSVFNESGISRTDEDCVRKERDKIYNEYFSKTLLKALMGENELKEMTNHIEEGTCHYRWSLFCLKCIRKFCNLFIWK